VTDKTNPAHYTRLDPEPITVIESWGLGFHLGNALKYIARAGHKDGVDVSEDLAKARWYIERELSQGGTLQPATEALLERNEELERDRNWWRTKARELYAQIRDLRRDPLDALACEQLAAQPDALAAEVTIATSATVAALDRGDDDDDDRSERPGGLEEAREGCVLGERCCCPHPFHGSDECFDADWADRYFAEQDETTPAPVEDGLAELRDAPATSPARVLLDFEMPDVGGEG